MGSTLRCSFSEADGIYTTSATPQVRIPLHPHLDFVTYIFSRVCTPSSSAATALIDGKSGESLTRQQIRARIDALAWSMRNQLNVQQGDRVMILLANCLEFPIIFNAILRLGAVATTSNPLNTKQEIQRQMGMSKPTLIFTNAAALHKVLSSGLSTVLVDDDECGASTTTVAFSKLLAPAPQAFVPPRIRQSDTAALLYSSGTTGVSKGVIISHGNLIATMAVAACVPDEMEPLDVILVLFPMYHIGGLIWLACGAVFGGPQLLLLPKYDILHFLAAVQRYKVTKVTAAPPVALDLLNSPLTKDYDISSLRSLLCAAAPLAKDTMNAVMSKLPHITKFIQLYGMTETTTAGSGGVGPLGSAGILKPCLEAKVIDLNTRKALPPTGRGELLLRGPFVMQGYLDNAAATVEAIDEHGWLHTGDMVYFDDSGYLYIVDRLKELIKYKGYQVAPAELEAILLTHPGILDCAVVPCPDDAAGEIPVACVVRKQGLTSDEVMDYVSSQVSPYKKVRSVVFVESIPKSVAGKILRKDLKLQLARQASSRL